MRFICLDGATVNLNIDAKDYVRHKSRSELQAKVKEVIKELFPKYDILEDFSIPNSGGLSIDFFIPILKLCVEVQGQQHYKFVPMFHRSKQDFISQVKNDGRKDEWCEMNGLRLVKVPHNATNIREILIS